VLAAAREILAAEPLLRVDYLALVDPERFERVTRLQSAMLLVVAIFAGKTRLIDNLPLRA
jgi:pantoate--beta-alanine ligase